MTNKQADLRIVKQWDGYTVQAMEAKRTMIFVGTIGPPCVIVGGTGALAIDEARALVKALEIAIQTAQTGEPPRGYEYETVEADDDDG